MKAFEKMESGLNHDFVLQYRRKEGRDEGEKVIEITKQFGPLNK